MNKRMVQGLVSPRKRPSAKAGIRKGDGFKKVEEKVRQTLYRAHQNPDFMDRSFEEEKLWWQVILREQMSRGYYRRSRSVCLVIRRYMEKLKYRSLVEENILLLASLSHKRSQTLLLYWNNKNVRCPNGEWEFNFGVSLVTINYQRKDRECQGYGVNNQTQGYVSLTSKLMMVYKCFGHLWFLRIQLYCSTELISINLMRLLYWNNRSGRKDIGLWMVLRFCRIRKRITEGACRCGLWSHQTEDSHIAH
ncbi:hypothetical protein Bca101_052042 [Brassica carinata]